ncbi:MAG TPA: ADP-ribosylglycohydrolase family protein, partial [Rubrobacteraceae bacterium]|nr:ADP-ribosylglycohydrolase family protein [Rubrobacteraceae bacterium]
IITHGDPRCSAGAIAIAGAVSLVLSDQPVEPASLLDRLAELTEGAEPRFAADLRELKHWLSLPPQEAVRFISRPGLDPEIEREQPGIPPFVGSSVLWSLYSFLTSPEDYWRTIHTAIAVGGDVDTTAAMAGAISGARLGLDAVPRDLARCLTDRGAWGLAELAGLADECYTVRQRLA